MIALGKLDQFEPDSNFLAWMARIVRFVGLNHGRRRASQTLVDPDSLDRSRESPSPESGRQSHHASLNGRGDLMPDQSDFDDRVLVALRTLEPNARACLLLRIVLNMPYREIARSLDIAEGTAMSHVHRARLALRDMLSPADTNSPRPQPAHHPGDAHTDG